MYRFCPPGAWKVEQIHWVAVAVVLIAGVAFSVTLNFDSTRHSQTTQLQPHCTTRSSYSSNVSKSSVLFGYLARTEEEETWNNERATVRRRWALRFYLHHIKLNRTTLGALKIINFNLQPGVLMMSSQEHIGNALNRTASAHVLLSFEAHPLNQNMQQGGKKMMMHKSWVHEYSRLLSVHSELRLTSADAD